MQSEACKLLVAELVSINEERAKDALRFLDLGRPFEQKDSEGKPPLMNIAPGTQCLPYLPTALWEAEQKYSSKARTILGGILAGYQCVVPIKIVAKACHRFLAHHWNLFQGYFSPHVQHLYNTNWVRHKTPFQR